MNTMANVERLLLPLAVWGEADATTLQQLDDTITYADLLLLTNHPAVQQQAGLWQINPTLATRLLTELTQHAPATYRCWHEKALTYAAEQLRKGNHHWEERFIDLLDRFATYLAQPDPKLMEKVLEQVADVPLRSESAHHRWRYVTGLAYVRQDRHSEAVAVFETLLAEPTLDRQIRGRALNLCALSYETMGQWQKAKEGYQQSLTVMRELGDRLSEGKALQNLGAMACQFQDYSEAENILLAAMACFEETQAAQSIAAVHNELGLIYHDQGRWAEALYYFQLCADFQRQQSAHDVFGVALLNIGEVLLFQGKLEEAETTLQEALALMQTRIYAIDVALKLGMVRQVSDDLVGAQAAYQTALDTALAIERRDILAEIYYRLGEVARLQGENASALAYYEQAAQVIENTREPIQDEGLKISLLGRWQQIYEALVLHCWQMNQPAAAWQWAERARARAFAEQMVLAFSPDTSARGDALNANQIGNSTFPASPVVGLPELQAKMPDKAVILNYFTTGVFDNHSPFLRALAPDNPLRVHLLTPACTLLFAITRQSIVIHQCPIDPNAFLSSSRRAEDRSRYLTPAMLRQLRQRLLPAAVLGAARQLYLIPHGPLHYVPFAALADADGQTVVHEGGPDLVYAPSATILYQQWLMTHTPVTATEAALAIGYDSTVAGVHLRHTENEAQLIADLTKGVAWVGAQPKLTALRNSAARYRWLHFACHGWFDYETPLESHLLTGAEERLTAEEVLREWRLEAELVTLSACQTGVHRLLRGDEPMGLIRGFLAAGARAVLATQWPVEDLPTFLLMSHFYRSLVNSPQNHLAAALRSAQLWLAGLSQAELQEWLQNLETLPSGAQSALPPDEHPFAHPRFWAAFVLFSG